MVVVSSVGEVLRLRRAGLQLRDSFLIAALTFAVASVFRAPLEGTVLDTVLRNGVGALNVDACRVRGAASTGDGRWPSNILLVHMEGWRCT